MEDQFRHAEPTLMPAMCCHVLHWPPSCNRLNMTAALCHRQQQRLTIHQCHQMSINGVSLADGVKRSADGCCGFGGGTAGAVCCGSGSGSVARTTGSMAYAANGVLECR